MIMNRMDEIKRIWEKLCRRRAGEAVTEKGNTKPTRYWRFD